MILFYNFFSYFAILIFHPYYYLFHFFISFDLAVAEELKTFITRWERSCQILIRQEQLLTERLTDLGSAPSVKFILAAERGELDGSQSQEMDGLDGFENFEIGGNDGNDGNDGHDGDTDGDVDNVSSSSSNRSSSSNAKSNPYSNRKMKVKNINDINTIEDLILTSMNPSQPMSIEEKMRYNSILEGYDSVLQSKRASYSWVEAVTEEPIEEQAMAQLIEQAKYVASTL